MKFRDILNEANINFNKFVKPVKNNNYRTGSPYGLITPFFMLTMGSRIRTALPKNHKEFIEWLNKKQPKNVDDYQKVEIEFLNRKGK